MEEQDWAQVVAAATRAPSIHNTQPWRFVGRARPAGASTSTPSARCRSSTRPHASRSSAAASPSSSPSSRWPPPGYDGEVDLLPDDGDPDHLATVRVDRARASRRTRTARWPRRSTAGTPSARRSSPGRVPAELVDRLQARGRPRTAPGSSRSPGPRRRWRPSSCISRAEEMEQSDPAYLAELQSWMRTDPGAVDGVPVEAVPSEDPRARPSNWLIRDFVVGAARAAAPSARPATPTPRRRPWSGRPSC